MTIEEQATTEDVSVDNAEDSSATATPEVEQETAQPNDSDKAAKALQRRIDRLTREKYELKAQNEQLSKQSKQVDDHANEDQDVETRAEARAREIADLAAVNKRCNEIAELGTKENKEFIKSFKTLTDEIGHPFDAKGKPTPIMAAILDADEAHKLIIHLSENPELAEELLDLTPSKQIRRIAQIERDMNESAKPKPSSAPKPVNPVSGGSSASKDPSAMTDAEFNAWRRADIAKRNK